RTHQLPILIFNFKKQGNIVKAISGQRVGTRISPGSTPAKESLSTQPTRFLNLWRISNYVRR
ncbi:MAG: hypothetical protein ACKO9Q_27030, partial [Pirellula sp.]